MKHVESSSGIMIKVESIGFKRQVTISFHLFCVVHQNSLIVLLFYRLKWSVHACMMIQFISLLEPFGNFE